MSKVCIMGEGAENIARGGLPRSATSQELENRFLALEAREAEFRKELGRLKEQPKALRIVETEEKLEALSNSFNESSQQLVERLLFLEKQLPALHAWRTSHDGLQRALLDWQKRIETSVQLCLKSAEQGLVQRSVSLPLSAGKNAKTRSARKPAPKRKPTKRLSSAGKGRTRKRT